MPHFKNGKEASFGVSIMIIPFPNSSVSFSYPLYFWILFSFCFCALHIASYFAYRIAAYYFKWKRDEKSVHQIFEEIVKYIVLVFVIYLATDHTRMFSCSIDHTVLEYFIPFFITLFTSGFLCEVPYLRVRLIDMRQWGIQTWVILGCIIALLIFLVVFCFTLSSEKGAYFVPVIPVVVYFITGFVISLFAHHPSLKFHPRSYQLAFMLCLLRKRNDFYSRLLAAVSEGFFLRCVAANPMLSLLEEENAEEQASQPDVPPSQETSDHAVITMPSSAIEEETLYHPLIVNEEPIAVQEQSADAYDDSRVEAMNETILQEDEKDNSFRSFLDSSRASDYGDWNDQQKQDLSGNHD